MQIKSQSIKLMVMLDTSLDYHRNIHPEVVQIIASWRQITFVYTIERWSSKNPRSS